MKHMAKYNRLIKEYGHIADFLTVYTSEAHPLDEWALLNHEKFSRYQHTTVEDRISAASVLLSEGILGQLAVDSMENGAVCRYAAMPERFYIIQDSVVQFKSGLGPFDYRPEDVENWLQRSTETKV